MHMNYCSSHEYLHETLFILLLLFPESTIDNIIIIEYIDTVHNIQTDTIHYSYCC